MSYDYFTNGCEETDDSLLSCINDFSSTMVDEFYHDCLAEADRLLPSNTELVAYLDNVLFPIVSWYNNMWISEWYLNICK